MTPHEILKTACDPEEGNLKVWWIPQVPMKSFEFPVSSVEEAAKIMVVLANYDIFQFENRVKPDYCNAGGLSVFRDGEWIDWEDEVTCESDPVEYVRTIAASNVEAKQ